MIRQQKWLLGIALCLCMLAGTAMVTTKAAAGHADPPTITFGDFSDGRCRYHICKCPYCIGFPNALRQAGQHHRCQNNRWNSNSNA